MSNHDIEAQINLFKEFQKTYNTEKIEGMTLDEYTNLIKYKKGYFTYRLEHELDRWGDISGGSSLKFAIYKKNNNKSGSQKGVSTDGVHAWHSKYSKDKNSAFIKIKNNIIFVKEAIETGKLNKIDAVNLGQTYKWKLAFHFQNPNEEIKIIPIYKTEVLKKYLKERGVKLKKPKQSDLYAEIKKIHRFNTLEEAFYLGDLIWAWYVEKISVDPEIKGLTEANRIKFKSHLVTERSIPTKFVNTVKEERKYTCQACNFKFENQYGKIGKGYIELHHIEPFSQMDNNTKRELIRDNFLILCANCHRMIHRVMKENKGSRVELEKFIGCIQK